MNRAKLRWLCPVCFAFTGLGADGRRYCLRRACGWVECACDEQAIPER